MNACFATSQVIKGPPTLRASCGDSQQALAVGVVAMFNFTPLLGAQSASAASQSLLELDGGIKILVDVGWDESFDAEKLKELERYSSQVQQPVATVTGFRWRPTNSSSVYRIGRFLLCQLSS